MAYLVNYAYRIFGQLDYLGLMFFVFLTFASLAVAVTLFLQRRDFLGARLSRLLNAGEDSHSGGGRPKLVQKEPSGLVAKVVNPLHAIAVPSDEDVRGKVRLKLIRAGYRSKQAYRYFGAAKVLLALVMPLIYLVRGFFMTIDLQMLLVCVLLGGVGFLLPEVVLLQRIQKRQQRIRRALPDALDMMVVCVEAGLGLDMTFKKVGDEIKSLNDDLSVELHLTNLEIRAGKTRDESLKNLALRIGIPEMQNLVTLLVQTNRFGTSVAKALRVHAEGIRVKRRQLAETKAAKSVVTLLFPLIFFIFPAFFVVVVGPAIIRIARNLLPVLRGH